MRKVWGRANSSNVMKVVWLLEELGLPYERIDAGGAFGRTAEAEYRAMNPTGGVPTLQEDGFTLWESNAILRYLATSHGAFALWPGELRARAGIDRWMDWQQASVTPPQTTVFQGLVRTAPEQRDTGAIAAALVRLGQVWSLLDRELARRSYVAGPGFTLADIALGVHVHRWFAFNVARPELPHLRAWHERLLDRPAYRRHCAVEMS